MANTNNPKGLSPVKFLSGAPWTGQARIYSVAAGDSTALHIGDPVLDAGTSQTWSNGDVTKDVVKAATTDVITGVVVAVLPDTRDSLIYRAASTARRVFVADSPDLLFEVQEGTGGTALTANDLGLNISFAAGTPSTATGYSGVTIDNGTEATTNTLALKLVEFVNRPDNAIGDSAKWLVRINRHRYADQLAGV